MKAVIVGASYETNIIACSLVDMRHPKLLKIARVRNETYYAACAAGKAGDGLHAALPFGIDVMLNPAFGAL